MRRYIPGLHSRQQTVESNLDGLFLVRVERAFYRWHPQKPFLVLRFVVLEPKLFESRSFSGRLYCTERALWKLDWFLRDFEYDRELLSRDQIDEKALLGLRGVMRTSHTTLNGRSTDSFAVTARTTMSGLSALAVAAIWRSASPLLSGALPRRVPASRRRPSSSHRESSGSRSLRLM